MRKMVSFDRLVDEYVCGIKNEIRQLEDDLDREIDDISRYADQYLEYTRGADYELMVEDATSKFNSRLEELRCKMLQRGVNRAVVDDIFSRFDLPPVEE